jgi:hypothetical protein
MGLIACCCSETRFKRERLPCVYVFIFGMMAVWALVRPQNQLLLLGSLVLLPWVQRRGAWFLSWLCGLVVWKGLQAILLGQGGLVFPYSFSFWVGTSVFPNHDLFREYHSSGFSIDQMMAMSGLLLEKLSVGWSFLKQYWSSWLPHLLLCVLALWNRVSRPIALVLLFLHLSTIGLSAMGHLVPRYWEVLEVLLLLLLMVNLDVLRGGLKEWGPVIILVLVVLGIGLDSARVAPLRDSWLRPRQIHSLELPYSIREQLRGDHWVASDHPAAVVDAIQRPILLLPNRAEQLFEINREVKLMKSIVFTPKLEFGELSNWSSQLDVLEQYGYRCVVSIGGWRLWRLMGTKNEGC